VVHAYGYARIIEDADWLRAHVTRLTAVHEAGFPEPWKVTDAPDEYITSLVKGIVGIEVPIESLEGKWKVNQNRSAADRAGVVSALESLGDPDSGEMARLVATSLLGK
jgi:transcriptional regulator